MTSTFNSVLTAASQRTVGLRFALEVQGIDDLYLSAETPLGPTGAAWAAPTSSGESYVYHPYTLDASEITDPGAEVTRSSSEVSPGSMSLTLQDNRGEELLERFAFAKDGGAVANLTASVHWEPAGGTGTVTLNVDDSSAFTVGDYVYLGRETLKLTAKTATTMDCNRDLFSLGYGDSRYIHMSDLAKAPRIVTNYPRVWVGRYVRLWSYVVDLEGRAFDNAWARGHMREIWRGVLRSNPYPDTTWSRWRIEADAIGGILNTEIGRETKTGRMVRVPGSLKQNQAGTSLQPDGSPLAPMVMQVDESVDRVNLYIEEWNTATDLGKTDPNATYDYTGSNSLELTSGPYSHQGILLEWAISIADVTEAATTNNVRAQLLKSKKHGWKLGASCSPGGCRITYSWNNPESVGPLLGYTGTVQVTYGLGGDYVHPTPDPDKGLVAVFIGKAAKTIPYYYEESSGLSVNDAPNSGYAVIGEDEDAEVLFYSGITTETGGLGKGIKTLNNCERGLMGTRARDHKVYVDDIGNDPDSPEMKFGIGLETFLEEDKPPGSNRTSSNIITAMLKLAITTGGGGHGTYDVLTETAGAALNPHHFDTSLLDEVVDAMTPAEKQLGLFLSEGANLKELIAEILSPLGLYMHGKLAADNTYRIGITEILPPLESEQDITIDSADVDLFNAIEHQPGGGKLVNEIECSYYWDAGNEEALEDAIIRVRDMDSQLEHGVRNKIDWELKGKQFSVDQALAHVTNWAQAAFQRFGRVYDVLTVHTGRQGLLLESGDTCTLTQASIPTSEGSRGLTDKLCRVLQVERRWAGRDPGATLTLILETEVRHSSYVPCARIASAAGADVTLEANAFTQVGSDVDHFGSSHVIWCYEDQGDVSSRVQRTINSINGNVITLNSALGFTPSADSLITGGDYAQVTANQKQHVHVADGSSPPVLSTSTATAFKYI